MIDIAEQVRRALGPDRLRHLEDIWAYSPVWICAVCGRPADRRIDDAALLAYLDDTPGSPEPRTLDALAHLACGPSQVLPWLTPPPGGHPPGGSAMSILQTDSTGRTWPILLTELGFVTADVIDGPGGPVLIDQHLAGLRAGGFATLRRDPLNVNTLPPPTRGWALRTEGGAITQVTGPSHLPTAPNGLYLYFGGFTPAEPWMSAATAAGHVQLLVTPPRRVTDPIWDETNDEVNAAVDAALRTRDHDEPDDPGQHRLCRAIDRGEVVGATLPLETT